MLFSTILSISLRIQIEILVQERLFFAIIRYFYFFESQSPKVTKKDTTSTSLKVSPQKWQKSYYFYFFELVSKCGPHQVPRCLQISTHVLTRFISVINFYLPQLFEANLNPTLFFFFSSVRPFFKHEFYSVLLEVTFLFSF